MLGGNIPSRSQTVASALAERSSSSRMEDQRQYCLKWNNHPTNIAAVFDRLRMEELFVDVTLATQDRQVGDQRWIRGPQFRH